MYCLGTYYNTALIAVENNRGQSTNKTLAKCGYRKIFVGQDQQGYEEDVLTKYGISTQGSNKEDMINNLKARFREHPEEFQDLNTLREMQTFVVLDIGKTGHYIMGALPGCHDDDVMSYALALTAGATNQQTTSVNVVKNKEEGLPWQLRETKPQKNSNGRGLWKKSVVS
jgi:phage terminase large subunit